MPKRINKSLKQNNMKKAIQTNILDFTNGSRQENMDNMEINKNLLWWSEKTRQEEHMLTLSIEEIKDTLLVAVFAFSEEKENENLIAAAGIFLPRTWNKSEPYFNGKRVVEIGTNFVLQEHRRQGIGTELIDARLKYAKEQNWVPVSISSNEIVQKALKKLGGSLMEEDESCSEIRDLLCLRSKCEGKQPCKCCPLVFGCGWIFK